MIEPIHALTAQQHCALAFLIERDIIIGPNGYDRISVRTSIGRSTPDTGEIEPVPVLKRKAVALVARRHVKFRCRDEAAIAIERAAFRSHEAEGVIIGWGRGQAPRELNQFKFTSVIAYDRASATKGAIFIKWSRLHNGREHSKNISRGQCGEV